MPAGVEERWRRVASRVLRSVHNGTVAARAELQRRPQMDSMFLRLQLRRLRSLFGSGRGCWPPVWRSSWLALRWLRRRKPIRPGGSRGSPRPSARSGCTAPTTANGSRRSATARSRPATGSRPMTMLGCRAGARLDDLRLDCRHRARGPAPRRCPGRAAPAQRRGGVARARWAGGRRIRALDRGGAARLVTPGRYRFDRFDRSTQLTVYAGQARFEGPGSALVVDTGQRGQFWLEANGAAQYSVAEPVRDAFAGWVGERDRAARTASRRLATSRPR